MNVNEMIKSLTLEEKAALLAGMGEWESRALPKKNIESIVFSDGPHGLRRQAGAGDHLGLNASLPATCFPTAATMASSWDESMGEEVGACLGQEANALGVNVLLGPGLNMKRSPLCGRNFEYFAEDPYLAGKMAASYVRGIQSQGVYACPKHFAVNSREYKRMAMNAVLDERTLREIYLTAFEIAVKEAKAKSIMSAYNEINGEYANENYHVLVDILRNEWGFDGIVVTDWGASNDHVLGAKCQSNVEMPNPGLDSAREVVAAVNSGKMTMAELDTAITPLLEAVLYFRTVKKEEGIREEEHHAAARKAAAASAVLLKNDGGILPLKAGTKVAVIGDFAVTPRYQGAGSSVVNATKVESIQNVISEYDLKLAGIEAGYARNTTELVKENLDKALALAKDSDVVLYFFGLDEISESEGADRTHMKLPKVQRELLEKLAAVNSNIVGVLSAGSAIEMPWLGSTKALLHTYLGGQAGASAAMDLLTGKVNPSGKLAETFPVKYEDVSVYNYSETEPRNLVYKEGPFIGYRYYDTCKVPVTFPFGFGLSYTTFAYSDLSVDAKGVSFTLTNTGAVDGAEVCQLYIGLKDSMVLRPAKELKGFAKVFLKAGESRAVTIAFDDKSFRFFNVKSNRWEIESGSYDLYVGASSADIRLTGAIAVKGNATEAPYKLSQIPTYVGGDIQNIPDSEFEVLYGKSIPKETKRELNINDAICQLKDAKSGICRLVYKVLKGKLDKANASGKPDLNILFVYNMPFRATSKMSGGLVSREMSENIVKIANGHFFGGLGGLIAGFFRNSSANKAYEKKLK